MSTTRRTSPDHDQRPGPERRGAVFIALAITIVIFFGVAAWVVDLGMFRLTFSQMNAATGAAALEGLRYADALPDTARRVRASQLVLRINDEDQDLSTDDDVYGLGPLFAVDDGDGSELALNALLQTGVANPADTDIPAGVNKWKRKIDLGGGEQGWLELNPGNLFYGDMVAGEYDETQPHNDYADNTTATPYQRADFDHTGDDSAFLVRLRRTTTASSQDREPGVSSAGPPIPFMMARASMAQTGPTGNNPRAADRGMVVRATAIADSKRAATVGPLGFDNEPDLIPEPPLDFGGAKIQGVAPFALDLDYWNSGLLVVGGTDSLRVAVGGFFSGSITRVGGGSSGVGVAYRSTSLAADVNIGDGVMFVRSARGFFPIPPTPDDFPFTVRLDNGVSDELVRVTRVQGIGFTQWTIDRDVDDDGTNDETDHTGGLTRVTLSRIAHAGLPLDPGVSRADGEARLTPDPNTGGLYSEFVMVPIYKEIAPTTGPPSENVLVGFGRARVTWDPGVPDEYVIEKLPARVAPRNASAAFPRRWIDDLEVEFGGGLSDTQIDEIVAGVVSGLESISDQESVLAPALVRSYDPDFP
jgi:hypothetical protein